MDDVDFGGVEDKMGLWGREIDLEVEKKEEEAANVEKEEEELVDAEKEEEEEVVDAEREDLGMKDAVAPGWETVFQKAGLKTSVEGLWL